MLSGWLDSFAVRNFIFLFHDNSNTLTITRLTQPVMQYAPRIKQLDPEAEHAASS